MFSYISLHWKIVFTYCVHKSNYYTFSLLKIRKHFFATEVRKIHFQNVFSKTSITITPYCFSSKSFWCLDNIFVSISSKKLYRKGFFAVSAYRLSRSSLAYIFQVVYTLYKRAIARHNWFVWALGETAMPLTEVRFTAPRCPGFFSFFFQIKARSLALLKCGEIRRWRI